MGYGDYDHGQMRGNITHQIDYTPCEIRVEILLGRIACLCCLMEKHLFTVGPSQWETVSCKRISVVNVLH